MSDPPRGSAMFVRSKLIMAVFCVREGDTSSHTPVRKTSTGTVTDEKYYEDHAALLGLVTLAWNDCHYFVLSIFHTLSGLSWEKAYAIFLALKSDHDRREITLALMKTVLDTDNDEHMREQGARLLG